MGNAIFLYRWDTTRWQASESYQSFIVTCEDFHNTSGNCGNIVSNGLRRFHHSASKPQVGCDYTPLLTAYNTSISVPAGLLSCPAPI